jgi:hypothetical protein
MSNNLVFNNCTIENVNTSNSIIQTKWCSKCKTFKSLEESFGKNKSTKDGYQSYCKECKRNSNNASYHKNKDKWSDYVKEYRKNNKELINKKDRDYYERNRDKVLERHKIYREKNRDIINSKKRERYSIDLSYKITNNLRSGLYQALTNQNATKRNSTLQLTGLSIEELTDWLQFTEKFYVPKNYQGTIDIEHMMPFAKVDLSTLEGQERVMNWKNLRHYTSKENNLKRARLPTPLEKLKQLLICYLFKVTFLDQNEDRLSSSE